MEIHVFKSINIELNGAEVDLFSEILRLAQDRLNLEAPIQMLGGLPYQSQCGISGAKLVAVKQMLAKLIEEV